MRYRLVHGAPKNAPQPLAWAKREGLPMEDSRWNSEAGCLNGSPLCRVRRVLKRDPIRGQVEEALAAQKIHLGRKLGCGTFGCAYLRRDYPQQVVKVTGDPSEVAAAERVIAARKHGHKLPGVVKFYRVFAVRDSDLCIVIQERLSPLRENEYAMVEEQHHRIYNLGSGNNEAAQRKMAKKIGEHYGVNPSEVYSLIRVFPELRGVGVEYHDLHEGNVLRTSSGHLKVIDLGISRSGNVKVREV